MTDERKALFSDAYRFMERLERAENMAEFWQRAVDCLERLAAKHKGTFARELLCACYEEGARIAKEEK